ncbi:MAG: hypothetical protein JWN96_1073 [Mycobacterium sp.]|jgi:uncharacterized protein (TIGR00730 family)|nr:hypothetical protein [Mycobacterium sp.]
MRAVCVFCGSSDGRRPEYREAASALGTRLGQAGITVVYGGASVGLMGAVADAALAAGGQVIGVIPRGFVDRELAHPGLTELHVTNSMHERKALMADLSEGFVALPGGLGTLEELAEITTWAQLGLHRKPVGVLDVAGRDGVGFYALLLGFIDHMVAEGFVTEANRRLLVTAATAGELLDKLLTWQPPKTTKWNSGTGTDSR